jgi:hypothetical protein
VGIDCQHPTLPAHKGIINFHKANVLLVASGEHTVDSVVVLFLDSKLPLGASQVEPAFAIFAGGFDLDVDRRAAFFLSNIMSYTTVYPIVVKSLSQ